MVLHNRVVPAMIVVFVSLYSVYLLVNGLYSNMISPSFDFGRYFSYFSQFTFAFATVTFIGLMKVDSHTVKKVLRLWSMLAFGASMLAVVQVISDDLIVDRFLFVPYYDAFDFGISRKYVSGLLAATAWFAEASHFGAFLAVPYIYTLYCLLTEHGDRRRSLLNAGMFAGIGMGVFLTYSLTAFLAVAIGMLSIMLLVRRYWCGVAFMLSACVALAYLFSDYPYIVLQIERIHESSRYLSDLLGATQADGTTTSFYVRSIGFLAAFEDFLDNPILGIGVGQGSVLAYHSGFLTMLAQQGIIGVLFCYSLPVFVILKLVGIRRKSGTEVQWLSGFFAVGLITDYTSGLITHHPMVLHRWFLVSLAVSWIYGLRWTLSDYEYGQPEPLQRRCSVDR